MGKKHHKHKKHTKKEAFNWNSIIIIAAVLTILVAAFGVYQGFGLNSLLQPPGPIEAPEIQITTITYSACSSCIDPANIVEGLKTLDVNVTEETVIEFSDAQDLISNYDINIVPTVIITGELDSFISDMSGFGKTIGDDVFVFDQLTLPYYDISQQKVLGELELTVIKDSSCEDCFDISQFIEGINSSGIAVTDVIELESSSSEAQSLISKYSIERIPTFIMSEEISLYELILDSLKQQGTIEDDGSYIWRNPNPPYIDLASGELKGLVEIVYLTDESCDECYDVTQHEQILKQGMLIQFSEEDTYDVSSSQGESLVQKYNITGVPTFVMSDEAGEYSSIEGVWSQVGTVEDDGWYVFRGIENMGIYKDLSTGEVVGQ